MTGRIDAVRVLVLVDGLHHREMIDTLSGLLDLRGAELLLAYVAGPAPRAGLELMTHRPGRRPLPPHREHELRMAEDLAAGDAIDEAEETARRHGAKTESIRLAGEPGRAVCEQAEHRRADLVVVHAGGRDRPPTGPRSLGPTARFITDHCRTAVLLLRSR
jgi:nucleotide-binding universal stress UspA family protein